MKDEIIEIAREILYIKEGEIKESTLLDDLIENSMDVVEFIAVLSNKYNMTIKPQELDKIKTVRDLVDYVEKNKGTRKENDNPLENY